MVRLKILIVFTFINSAVYSQVKVRVFSNRAPESAVFSVTEGEYKVDTYNGGSVILTVGEPVIISKYNGRLAVKTRNSKGLVCDSALFTGRTGNDSFSLRIDMKSQARQYYSGDFKCFPDLGTLVLINICNIEKYIAGVVKAEGGNGRNKEYFKTQAIITRTYLYKYYNKHMSDRYNVCDNTHCQVFNGLSDDTLINNAAFETAGLVLLDQDSTLIVSAFHSNCGGETSSSEDVWLRGLTYLKRVVDPYCRASGYALWERKMTLKSWLDFMKKSGYAGKTDDPSVFNFSQNYRVTDYKTGSFTIPLLTVRADLNLRSTFFSVFSEGDSIILKGRGFGHGVGLCQEGAMVMAKRGFNYRQIIDFYYTGVLISEVKNSRRYTALASNELPPFPNNTYGGGHSDR
jgi:stage II sporulation protein D